ncbi:glycosyltransferase family 4 protein [Geminocystis sp. GBBB08]|uniref:glycosyltransferase family 4 protein n=1 Tax=Geminocystis sp. GBBB08 TaxID=2604140 RepID=UPI0027E31127|nr:glycosyltransferase family 4 protein [Geminocystis sp. GBBB08]MBL1210469.1 glycosyltransferase family 4 protein [Geminocystis sp. GBBB08]
MFAFKNKKILVINNIYPPQELGGYGRYISDFANILRERGHQVKVLTSDASYLKEITELELGIDRKLILYGDYKQLPPTVIKDSEKLKQIISKNNEYIETIIKDFQPNVVLIGNIDLLGANIFKPFFNHNIPVINHLAFNQPGYSLVEKPNHPLYHLSTCSYHVKNNTLNLGYQFNDISVIYPGAYVDDFKQEKLPIFDQLKIVFASIISQYKGPQTLIEALAILHHEGFDFDCILAGATPVSEFKESLEKFITDNGMDDKVRLIGYQSRDSLIKLYGDRNVFIFPSVWDEPFGISQVEGMAAGLTTITSATGGASEIIEHGISGLKFQKNNPLSLGFCLLRLLAKKEDWKRISQQGIKRAKEFFDIYYSVDLLEEKFAELLLKKDNCDQWLNLREEKIINYKDIELTKINYLIFPHWQTDEEKLTMAFTHLIDKLTQKFTPIEGGEIITLVIDTTGITEEDANLFLSGIAMNLMLEKELNLENILYFTLISNLNEQEWKNLFPKITAKITLENENQDAINYANIEELVSINANNHNYVIFPDWKTEEQELSTAISQILIKINSYYEKENITLLVNITDANIQEVELFFSEIIMNLMLEEGRELSENISINFVDFTVNQWQSLGSLIKGKITLACESLPENLPLWNPF